MNGSILMSKHTPGPWKFLVMSNGSFGVQMGYDGGFMIHNDANPEANARLIAAAPELLEALAGLLAQTRQYGHEEENKAADAAIAKAKGEA